MILLSFEIQTSNVHLGCSTRRPYALLHDVCLSWNMKPNPSLDWTLIQSHHPSADIWFKGPEVQA